MLLALLRCFHFFFIFLNLLFRDPMRSAQFLQIMQVQRWSSSSAQKNAAKGVDWFTVEPSECEPKHKDRWFIPAIFENVLSHVMPTVAFGGWSELSNTNPAKNIMKRLSFFFSMHLYIRSFCFCSRCSKLTISSHPSWDFGCVHQPASQPAHLCRRSEWQIKIK